MSYTLEPLEAAQRQRAIELRERKIGSRPECARRLAKMLATTEGQRVKDGAAETLLKRMETQGKWTVRTRNALAKVYRMPPATLQAAIAQGSAPNRQRKKTVTSEVDSISGAFAKCLPPLEITDDAPDDFVRLIHALARYEADLQGCEVDLPGERPTSDPWPTTTISQRPFCGLKPVVKVSVERSFLLFRPRMPSRTAPRIEVDRRVKHWIFVTPDRPSPEVWASVTASFRPRGIEPHNFTQPEVGGWLRNCPPLLARYAPAEATKASVPTGYDGVPFDTWRGKFNAAVTRIHRQLHLFGFPDPHRRTEEDPDRVDPKTFLLSRIFEPQSFAAEGDAGNTRIALPDLLRRVQPTVLLGGPGTGKTSLVRFLALAFGDALDVGGHPLAPKVPLYLPLRDYADDLDKRPSLRDALGQYALKYATGGLAPEEVHPWKLDGLLLMGEAAVFFDGLDEVGNETTRQRISAAILKFHRDYPLCPLWITSRLVGYDVARLKDDRFAHFVVQPFSVPQQRAFIDKWFEAQFPGERPEVIAKRKGHVDTFHAALDEALPQTRDLAEVPLLLTLMAWVHYDRGRLPDSRGDLYESCVDMLLRRREQERAQAEGRQVYSRIEELDPPITPAIARRYFVDIAYRAQTANQGSSAETRGNIPAGKLREWLTELRAADRRRHEEGGLSPAEGTTNTDVDAFLHHGEARTGLLRFRGGDEYAFAHLSFQEYLAACWYTDKSNRLIEELAKAILDRTHTESWRETLLLVLFRLRTATDEVPFSDFLAREALKMSSSRDPLLAPQHRHFFAMALRDKQPFTPKHTRIILHSIVETWVDERQLQGETYETLRQLARSSPAPVNPLVAILTEAWESKPPGQAIHALRLRVLLFGWPLNDPAVAASLSKLLRARLDSGAEESLVEQAGEVLADAGPAAVAQEPVGADCVRFVQQRLLERMRDRARKAKDRAASGHALGRLGDPRPGVAPGGEPPANFDELLQMEFCYVPGDQPPARTRTKGSKNRSDVEGFWIGRFPVTVAQFRVFATDENYALGHWWEAAKQAGHWEQGRGLKVTYWGSSNEEWVTTRARLESSFEVPNHPVVMVNWFEAMAFASWLQGRLREAKRIPAGWEVRLPANAHWEQAAQGGPLVPPEGQPVVRSLTQLLAEPAVHQGDWIDNPAPSRTYPWGNDQRSEQANWYGTGINATSAVGCCPTGISPVGAEEMAGNVWEWTDDGAKSEGEMRVLRGGSWIVVDPVGLRCGFRHDYLPGFRYGFIGFRCVWVRVAAG